MTGSANCDIVAKGRGDFCGAKLIGVISNSKVSCSSIFGRDSAVGIIRSVFLRYSLFLVRHSAVQATICQNLHTSTLN